MRNRNMVGLFVKCVMWAVGVLLLQGCSVSPPRILSASGVNLRLEEVHGTFSSGQIEFNDEGPNNSCPPKWNKSSPYKLDLKWTSLDLDGEGGGDDTLYFTLVAHGSNSDLHASADIQANDEGWGVRNLYLDPNESLRFEVENVFLSEDTKGTIQFSGFTGGTLIKASSARPGRYLGEINGQEVEFDAPLPKYSTFDVTFEPTNSVTFTGKVAEGQKTFAVVRAFGLQFSYEK